MRASPHGGAPYRKQPELEELPMTIDTTITPFKGEDIVVWPHGDWDYYEDIEIYTWRSDDYEIVRLEIQRGCVNSDCTTRSIASYELN
jgi:hypothetical protein